MTPSQLVKLEQVGDVLIISPLFTFGTFTETELLTEWTNIERLLREPTVQHVIIDLSEVPYFGSTVLEWMVLIWKRIRAKGGRLAVCNCSELGQKILAATRLDTLWRIDVDRAGAMATFA